MDTVFFVTIKGHDPIIVTVANDMVRPNDMDCHAVLEEWKTDNYGYKPYDYWEIDTCEKHFI